MRKSKGVLSRSIASIDYLRERALISKAACLCIILCVLVILSYVALSHLSWPPERGLEGRDYSECKDEKAASELCKTASVGDRSSEGVHQGSKDIEYKPNAFIKDKRDLTAQEGMWRATNTLAVFTLFQIFLGFGGLVIVAITLRETGKVLTEAGKTTKAANEATAVAIAQNQSFRAYVGFSDFISKRVMRIDGKYHVDWFVELKNFGQTMALDVQLFVKVVSDPIGKHYMGDARFADLDAKGREVLLSIAPTQPKAIALEPPRPVEQIRKVYNAGSYYIYCAVQYKSIFDDEVHKESFVLRLDLSIRIEDFGGYIDPDKRIFTAVQIPGKVNW